MALKPASGTNEDKGKPKEERQQTEVNRLKPGILDRISGNSPTYGGELKPYLPAEIIGGSVPYIPGSEDEAVWNAAAQSCGTEKVSYVYTVADDRCWYLAIPSAALASNPDSWCPLSSALPGNEEYWDKETVYLYEQEGLASALRWDPDTGRMQTFIGPSRTILPRIQSMDANFVTINAKSLKPIPWKNRMLRTEQLSRATAKFIVISGVLAAAAAFAYVFFIHAAGIAIKPDLQEAREKAKQATTQMMAKANESLQNESLRHTARIQELLDILGANDGTLLKYEVTNGKTTWEAYLPVGVQPKDIGIIGSRDRVSANIEKDEKGISKLKVIGSN